jgi:hypothetical protein
MDAVKDLESLPGVISNDKASILLVHGKLKPTALIVMEGPAFDDEKHPTHVAEESLATLEAVFRELGLHYVQTTEIMTTMRGGYAEVLRFFIAHDQATAERLKTLFDDVMNNDREIGLLLGYPQTAVDAFLTPNMLEMANTPESTEDVSMLNMRLLGHRLSKDNWREEVKYLEESGNYLKSVSPLIYDEMTSEE